MRESWTDERLDDLNGKVDRGFERVDGDVRELRLEIRELRGETKAGFDLVNARFDSLQRTIVHGFIAISAAALAGFAAIATQL